MSLVFSSLPMLVAPSSRWYSVMPVDETSSSMPTRWGLSESRLTPSPVTKNTNFSVKTLQHKISFITFQFDEFIDDFSRKSEWNNRRDARRRNIFNANEMRLVRIIRIKANSEPCKQLYEILLCTYKLNSGFDCSFRSCIYIFFSYILALFSYQ